METRKPEKGQRIGEFVLEELLGSGTDTQVWRARHHVLGTPARMKLAFTGRAAGALHRGGVALHAARHERLAEVLSLNLDHDPPFCAVTLADGETLRDRLDRGGPLPWERLGPLIQDVLECLDAAHDAGQAHGNLKPENVLVDTAGRARLLDFGGRESAAEDSMLSGALREGADATPAGPYVAPERRAGADPDPSGDLWAAGVLLFEALTGATPEGGETPGQRAAGLPPRVDAAYARAVTRLENRFASAADMAAALFPAEPPHPPAEDVTVLASAARCAACGHDNRLEYRYCVKCGVALGAAAPKEPERTCRRCGKPRFPHYRFCPYCGARYRNDG